VVRYMNAAESSAALFPDRQLLRFRKTAEDRGREALYVGSTLITVGT